MVQIRSKAAPQGVAGGWGAVAATEQQLGRQKILVKGNLALFNMNKPGGFDCPSCAWPDPKQPHAAEYCENGAKAVAWEATAKRTEPQFFAEHSVSELQDWSDFALEDHGRLTHPMRYNAETDHYELVDWETAIAEIGALVRGLDPKRIELYTSGRASNEAAFLWQLYGRLIGTNNFPDCSDMCHATTTVALPESIGVGKGTVTFEDWDACDAMFIIGQNPGTNSPRMLGQLHDMAKRGVPIVSLNPLKERGLVKFTDPQNPIEMLTGTSQKITSNYLQVKTGGDILALQAICKIVIEADDQARMTGAPAVLDREFIAAHTHGFDAFADYVRALDWERIERFTALPRSQIEQVADIYMKAKNVICCWGMGITQHRRGGEALQQIINLLLLRGNIGRLGAGASPIRGHSNVQGDRTVGINKTPTEDFLQKLDTAFGFESPREWGHDTAECCEAILRGEVDAFLALGGNFFRAIPDQNRITPKASELKLTVYMATKLNHSHLAHGQASYILPVLGRTELDLQEGGPQTVTVEDSFAMIHGSTGMLTPASELCRSEPWIVAALAKATIADRAAIDWDALAADYSRIRDKIEEVIPGFDHYNERIAIPGGFHLPIPPRERIWPTPTGKANFLFEPDLADEDDDAPKRPHFQLMTLRSHDQFNTTVYSYDDRYRGIFGERMIVFMNAKDIASLDLSEGDLIEFATVADDGVERRLSGFKIVAYDIPQGCCAAYFPETTALLPLSHRDRKSDTPAAKSIPVSIKAAKPVGSETGKAGAPEKMLAQTP
ncbi:FdhF/YdeP family oxidoreductase [Beijerinckia mobilis]|uniref:FdhF/YdeP family oxidoreductase n=1 Tax=Beijerinckia mobilis TaxID=231434 RepID=UPI000554D7B7|nr:FdhF/YdeP family oxidoreductase [Beijerinckia mobilis]